MIISDLAHLETVDNANHLEGGLDLAATISAFQQHATLLNATSMSTPAGSMANVEGASLDIKTLGAGLLALGL